ncbi:MAG TPA: hypothetical protein VKB50_23495 [Vicinamibacterales bacterium]|nr:hypothetical protein [Vicinamibacterales bacterium]
MQLIALPHIVAGALGIVFGFVALSAAKGGTLHRKSGMIFVCAMLLLSASGALMAVFLKPNMGNLMAGVLTFYLVLTAVLTVRRPSQGSPWLDRGAMLVGFGGGLSGIMLGFDAIALGGVRQGIPAPAFFIFGAVGLLGSAGDLRMIRAGGLRGAPRLVRHQWRMCLGLVIAAASFFFGPPGRVPEVINIPALLPVPVVAPIFAMAYWRWRLRRKGSMALLWKVS